MTSPTFCLPQPSRSSEPAALSWYALRTRSNQEKIAATILKRKGYEEFLPLYPARRRWSDRVVENSVPLFRGYVFCRFDAAKPLPVITTPAVISVVGFGGPAAAIADCEIEAIKGVLRSGLASEPCPFIREGQRVRLDQGPLKGLEGVVVKKTSTWKLVVSVTLLQRSLCVEIDNNWISAR